jgi:tetratricopeptide (TPR) repeat protein
MTDRRPGKVGRASGKRPLHVRRSGPPLRRWKKALFSVLATAGFFVLLELLLMLGGVASGLPAGDPYVGFASTVPLYEQDGSSEGPGYMVSAANKVGLFNQQRFSAKKTPGTYRIVSLGGSTTYGRPYDDTASFSGWLREFLKAADTSRNWEVINAGGVSYASYRVAKLMEELLVYEPDLFIIYSGHNEFLERRTYPNLIEAPAAFTQIGGWLSHTRIHTVGARIANGFQETRAEAPGRTLLSSEVDTILARSVGPQDYHRDDRFQEQVGAHYRFNLNRMLKMARTAGVKVILITPVSNLKDCSPFKSELSTGLTAKQAAEFQALFDTGQEAAKSGQGEEALSAFEKAETIDDRYAGLHYQRGRVLLKLERWTEAAAAFRRALQEDVCPLRILPSMRRTIMELAAEHDVGLIDFAGIIEQRSEHGIPGSEHFLDHVHLTIEGNRLLALELLAKLGQENIFAPSKNWNEASLQEIVKRVESGLDRRAHGIATRNLARVFAWAGKNEEAARLAKLTVKWLGEYAESCQVLGRQAQERGDHAEARSHFRKVLEVYPEYAEAHTLLGSELFAKGEAGEAIRHLREALRLKPDLAKAHGNLGLVLASLGESDEAIHHYREALRYEPDAAETHGNLGVELTNQGKVEEAMQHFRLALKYKPGYAEAHGNLGLVLSSRGQVDEAVEHFRRALEINPVAADIHFNLGVTLQKQERIGEAIPHYRAALKIEPEHAAAHYNLGIALLSLEKPREALAHFERANQIDPKYQAPADLRD